MPTIVFISHDQQRHEIQADIGDNLMQLAMDNGVPGIDADCGGSCACGTCHVYVQQNQESLVAPDDMETSMISMRPDAEDGSRLSCQLAVNADMDGLELLVPEFQM